MKTGKVYGKLAVNCTTKMYSYLTRFKNVAFHAKFFLRTTMKGPPPCCLPQGPHHPKSTPVYLYIYMHMAVPLLSDVLYCFFSNA